MTSQKRIGVTIMGRDAAAILANAEKADRLGISAVWLTTGRAGLDGLTLFAAIAQRTRATLMGTCIVPIFPRHPLVMAQQVQVIDQLAPGRFRLGVGPSHKAPMEDAFGIQFSHPLGHLREYARILKTLFQQGSIDFVGDFYQAKASIPSPVNVPVMASALRKGSFELCGAETDGAISWVCPGVYLRDVALPAMQAGAKRAGRPVPPLIAHVPVCVHNNRREVLAAVREQMPSYPRSPFYAQMFTDAGYQETKDGEWSDRMIDAVVASGRESTVADKLKGLLAWGATELLLHPIGAGPDGAASTERTLRLVAEMNKDVARG